MTITLGNTAKMIADAQSHPDPASAARLESIVKIASWMFEAEESGDLNVARYEINDKVVVLQLDAHDEGAIAGDPEADPPIPATPAKRVYDIHDDSSIWFWDVVAQKMDRVREGLETGKTGDELRVAARIDGTLVDALNEVEKARAWIEARI